MMIVPLVLEDAGLRLDFSLPRATKEYNTSAILWFKS